MKVKDQEAVEMQGPEMGNTHVPLLLASLQEIMQKHVRELREDHEYYMKVAYDLEYVKQPKLTLSTVTSSSRSPKV